MLLCGRVVRRGFPRWRPERHSLPRPAVASARRLCTFRAVPPPRSLLRTHRWLQLPLSGASVLTCAAMACEESEEDSHGELAYAAALQLLRDDDPIRQGLGVEKLTLAAESGHKEAMYKLAVLHYHGKAGVEQNLETATLWLERCALLGHPRAQHVLAALYFNGDGVPRNNARAKELYAAAASGGHTHSQYILGLMCAEEGDEAGAKEWLGRAAGSHGEAQVALARLYLNAGQAPNNMGKVLALLEQAASAGNTEATTLLAAVLFSEGGEGEAVRARTLLHDAAEESSTAALTAQVNLSLMLWHGWGGDRDIPGARKLLIAAHERGHPEAAYYLARLHLEEGALLCQDEDESWNDARAFLQTASARGHRQSQFLLAEMLYSLENGGGGRKIGLRTMPRGGREHRSSDMAEARRLYRVAADGGNTEAQNRLGRMLWLGQGGPADRAEARLWFSRASAAGAPPDPLYSVALLHDIVDDDAQ